MVIAYRGPQPVITPIEVPHLDPAGKPATFKTGHNMKFNTSHGAQFWAPNPVPYAAPMGFKLGILYTVALAAKELDWCDMQLPIFRIDTTFGRIDIPHGG